MFRIFFAVALLCTPSIAFAETCIASQYGVGDRYHGRRTASGAIFNTYAAKPYTVAHKTRPLGSFVTITNHANGRSIMFSRSGRRRFFR
jgi:rare lipoprotein A